ncbi:MAG: hypothetical protein RLZZ184_2943 [Cyanobacteriota bacterium]
MISEYTIIFPVDSKYSGKCGVTDFSFKLADELKNRGIRTATPPLSKASKVIKKTERKHILHLNYPCLNSRYSLSPLYLNNISSMTVLTLHETKTLNPLRQIFYSMFRTQALVVTNNYDYNIANEGRISKNIFKISIACPFSVKQKIQVSSDKNIKICYFGLIRPGKNLDQLASFSHELKKRRPDVCFDMICGFSGEENLLSKIRSSFNPETTWYINTNNEKLSDLLANYDMAYLPFPNGADENRSSLLSMFPLGIVPITYVSNRTPREFHEICKIAHSPESAIELIPFHKDDLANSKNSIIDLSNKYSWEKITSLYIDVYNHVINNPKV